MPNNEASDSRLAGKRVLVIEDEFLIALEVERILETAGIGEIVTLARPPEALTALQGLAFDVAILDFRLNGWTTTQIAERLIELAVPFIFLTGVSTQTVPAHLRSVPVVTKPFGSEALLGALHTAIGRG